ncbi:MAG: carboxymuconolactone decarboxylase family protein [Acidobacteria bacterium]|nr:carboxymuconolactone decarboxylase family protein [Acidobacteriota bacterium]
MKKRSVHTGSPAPATLRGFQRKFPEVWKAYEGFREACDDQGPLDTKTRELIKVAISVALGRTGGLVAHLDRCRAAGASKEEICQAILLAAPLAGFPETLAGFRVFQKQPTR